MPIELTEGLPDRVVGMEAVGKVTSDDFIAVIGGAVALVFFMFPKRRDEWRLLASYHEEDSATRTG